METTAGGAHDATIMVTEFLETTEIMETMVTMEITEIMATTVTMETMEIMETMATMEITEITETMATMEIMEINIIALLLVLGKNSVNRKGVHA